MSVLVRIAPSPTGLLHVGNVRTALVNWLFARKAGGKFMLRLDDTDQSRSKPEYAAAIEEDLRWLGMEWDSFARQSDRFPAYDAARQKLIASGRLYPCYETQEELDIRRKMQSSRGLPPIYDRASLTLTDAQRDTYAKEGRKPHYRFKLNDQPIAWTDMVRGPVKFESGHISDPVLIREDGIVLYTFASVVDDGDMKVSHIIRGEDHVSNTAVQVQIFEALGFALPTFGHLALLKTKEGELSKRTGGGDIRALREQGIEPMAINSYLARIGTSDPVEAFWSLDALAQQFNLGKFGRAPANYDQAELERLNEKLLAQTPFDAIAARLDTHKLSHITQNFWEAVSHNLKKLTEVGEWWEIVHGNPTLSKTDADYVATAATLLPAEPWSETTWSQWTDAIKTATGRKGKELFMPLRLALTGREHGPEMKQLLVLLGYVKVKERLTRA